MVFHIIVFISARSKSVIPGDGGVGTAHSDVKRSMEKPLKKGWLKKQRSIVKNWKPCYFVLRGNVLTYHKDDRESAVQVRDKRVRLILHAFSYRNECMKQLQGNLDVLFRSLTNNPEARRKNLKYRIIFLTT